MAIQKSIVRRYLFMSMLASTLPVLTIGLLYDRFTSSALEQLLGEKISAHLTATANRLTSYLEARRYQVETLASYPGMADLAGHGSGEVEALLQIESDTPDLYGILLFDAAGALHRVVPGQAASGPPYWADRPFEYRRLPHTALDETKIIGPLPARNGDSGWILVSHPLAGRRSGDAAGQIALHVRLASLTEQLGSSVAAGALQPLLRTPAGDFNSVGRSVIAHGKLIPGPEILPGWRPMLEVESVSVLEDFARERHALLFSVLISAALVGFLFYRLSRTLRRRVSVLLKGADAIAAGQLDERIDERGADEIASVSRAFNAMSIRLKDYLARAVRMERLAVLGEFATGIAHEIRNPLAAIKTSVQALMRREQEPRRVRLLADMEKEIDRLARVVSDLVDFGRPREPSTTVVSLGELLRSVATTLEPEAQTRGLTLDCAAEVLSSVEADPDHLKQILLNLVLNAMQATPAGGRVSLRSHAEAGRVMIEICDTGCGIPAELIGRMSDPFVTTKTRGVGLGLSISKQLCELNHGTLSIASKPGRGTVVRISLPGPGDHAEYPDH